ncbi:solute carrier family 52, riboflavin transporter, member 3-B-like [Haliotis cracherodii]|uniref:solute carrier family 52, riboflavin transporter, member 3-B-like n=1 Tax=Haliotis cracherodii TaxID=6455 RepID=UPI0039EC26DC
MAQICCIHNNVNVCVYILVILFGIASWIDINGLWVELPILVQKLPEGWDLPSYMVIIIQLANIGPLFYTLSKLRWPRRLNEVPIIYLIIGIGGTSCLLLAFFWNTTSYIAGANHSTALLILNFFLAFVDCTSSVVFLPYMAHFKPEYITAFFIGEGFSGLLPGLVALGQGAGQTTCVNQTVHNNVTVNGTSINETSYVIFPQYQTPKFSIEVFFFLLFGMLVTCGAAFTILHYCEFARLEQLKTRDEVDESTDVTAQTDLMSSYELSGPTANPASDNFLDAADNIHSRTHLITGKKRPEISIQKDISLETTRRQTCMTRTNFFFFLFLTAWINGLGNGVLPSIQSYSALPFGNTVYHLTVTLGSIANPLSCLVAFFLPVSSTIAITILTLLGTGFAAYCIGLAAMSPDPLLVGELLGNILVVAAWFFVTFLLTFTKVSIASLLRVEGKRALLWCGAMTQVGSAVGALAMFLLVNVFKMFKQGSPCR